MATTFIADEIEERHIDHEQYLAALEYVRDDGRKRPVEPEER